VAVIGPLADDGYEQLGTWVFDGESRHSHTCLQALHALNVGLARLDFTVGSPSE
jgi:beta-glucosidase